MISRYIFSLGIISILFIMGCSTLYTRQFIVPPPTNQQFADAVKYEEWLIAPPTMVAYKGIKDTTELTNSSMFWLSIKSKKNVKKNTEPEENLIIDTVNVELDNGDVKVITATRIQSFWSTNRKEFHFVYDFYGEEGVIIPTTVYSLILRVKAKILKEDLVVRSEELTFKLARDEGEVEIPLSGWR